MMGVEAAAQKQQDRVQD